MTQPINDNIRDVIREQYRKIAILDSFGYCRSISACGSVLPSDSVENIELIVTSDSIPTLDFTPSSTSIDTFRSAEKVTSTLESIAVELGYSNVDASQMAMGCSIILGCGNPKAIASLESGETVLDLGSGSGVDCFLAANEVGRLGKVIGVDMTPEMISVARTNAKKKGYKNIEFRLGEIENLPVADGVIDVIISNCVINLSPEKMKVFTESFRVLKAGGRLAISDVVATALLPDQFKNDTKANTLCISRASFISDIEAMLCDAGFVAIEIKPKLKSKAFIKNWIPHSKLENYVVSATIEAIKPKIESQ